MKVTTFLFSILLIGTLEAEVNYISGVQKVTFRTGPGRDNKIIKMVETDSKITVLETGEKWTKVKVDSGEEGYILNRFLTKDVPFKNKYLWIKGKYEKLQETQAGLKDKMTSTNSDLTGIKAELEETKKQLLDVQTKYDELKTGSADYIGLKSKYDSTIQSLTAQTAKVKTLESKISTYYIKWFIAGASVLFLGWLIGLISRKKKNYSSIRL